MEAKTKTKTVIFINDEKFQATAETMTGSELKNLGDLPHENRLFRELPGPEQDTPIGDEEVVELRNGDRFYDLPRGVHGALGLSEEIKKELGELTRTFGEFEVSTQSDGTVLVTIGPVDLPPGWHPNRSKVLIVVPPGYPDQRPGGFFIEPGFTVNGGVPRGSGANEIAGRQWTYMCWHPETWHPRKDNLWKYIKLMLKRFEEAA